MKNEKQEPGLLRTLNEKQEIRPARSTFYLEPSVRGEIARLSAINGVTASSIVNRIIIEYINNKTNEGV